MADKSSRVDLDATGRILDAANPQDAEALKNITFVAGAFDSFADAYGIDDNYLIMGVCYMLGARYAHVSRESMDKLISGVAEGIEQNYQLKNQPDGKPN